MKEEDGERDEEKFIEDKSGGPYTPKKETEERVHICTQVVTQGFTSKV